MPPPATPPPVTYHRGTRAGSAVSRAAARAGQTPRRASTPGARRKRPTQRRPSRRRRRFRRSFPPRDLEATKKNTTANITTAEQNLQLANGKQLSAAQKDLTEKIKGFLSQSHEAIMADDWVRAQNLAEKARVLSAELVKSF